MSRDHRASDQLTADTIHVPCPECGVGSNVPCVNPLTGVSARVPCHKRITAAERDRPVGPGAISDTVTCHEETTER